jgi:hypothetical protein
MTGQTVTFQLPENLYMRIQHVAQATHQSLNEVFVRMVQIGSPPDWQDVPAEFQADLAALDRLDDASLWRIARSCQPAADADLYQQLLDKNANGLIADAERITLQALRTEADRFMLRKAHAAALLRWRGHQLPPADKL